MMSGVKSNLLASKINLKETLTLDTPKKTGYLRGATLHKILDANDEYNKPLTKSFSIRKKPLNIILSKKMRKTLQEWEQKRKDTLPPL